MKNLKLILLLFTCLYASITKAQEALIDSSAFKWINLETQGLEKVKALVAIAKYDAAAAELLNYYRLKSNTHLDFNADVIKSLKGKKVNENTLELANNILLHHFKPHKGYPTYDYGKDINWQHRPVKDQLLTTFLHRTAFWEPLGIAYQGTGDEKYAKEWVSELRDWVKKNRQGAYADDKDYAWKAFVVSFRLNHWSGYFNLFLYSQHFTPAFLMEFLNAYHEQAVYVMNNYTDLGNHRLYEALHLIYAGSYFPELQGASAWRKSGISVLTTEIDKQLLPDGVQFELSPSYHIGAIKIFLDALQIAQLNGSENEFPESYRTVVEKMVLAVGKYSFPDYTFPLYGNSFLTDKNAMLKNYRGWQRVFPQNKTIEYYATDGKSGKKPGYLSTALPNAGFYSFRNGWDMNATVMQVKAGPPAEFHSHPDNGNFVLWVKGRDFTPDAGSFIYANVGNQENAKRDWYRSTKAHQTLTLNDRNIENNAKLQKWQTGENLDVLTYLNPSYPDLNHQRTFLFINHNFFVIIDRALGKASGKLNIRYNLKEDSKATVDGNNISTHYADDNNLLIQVQAQEGLIVKAEPSFVSYLYQKESPRPAFAFEKFKNNQHTQGFISVLYPYHGQQVPSIKITPNAGHDLANGKIDLHININGKDFAIKQLLD